MKRSASWPSDRAHLSVTQEVLTLHADQLERYGGAAGIRDLGLLESAVETPGATFDGEYLYDGLIAMTAAYAFHIVTRMAIRRQLRPAGLSRLRELGPK